VHLTDPELQALDDGEVAQPAATVMRQHLAECPACRGRFDALQRAHAEAAALLAVTDAPAPSLSAETIIRRANYRASRRRVMTVVATGATVLMAVAASAAIPGSPTRSLLAKLLTARSAEQVPHTQQVGTPADTESVGVALVPDHEVVISFGAQQTSGTIRVHLTDSTTVSVTAPGRLKYSVGTQSVVVSNANSQFSFDISLPRGLHRARIMVVSRVVFQRQDSSVLSIGKQDSLGRYVIPFNSLVRGTP
jgi:anti-sigma factor RsiW